MRQNCSKSCLLWCKAKLSKSLLTKRHVQKCIGINMSFTFLKRGLILTLIILLCDVSLETSVHELHLTTHKINFSHHAALFETNSKVISTLASLPLSTPLSAPFFFYKSKLSSLFLSRWQPSWANTQTKARCFPPAASGLAESLKSALAAIS